jgi:hypothetical protein
MHNGNMEVAGGTVSETAATSRHGGHDRAEQCFWRLSGVLEEVCKKK